MNIVRKLLFVGLISAATISAQAQRIPDSSVTGTARASIGIDPKLIAPTSPGEGGGIISGAFCGSVAQHRDGQMENVQPCQGVPIYQVIVTRTLYSAPRILQTSRCWTPGGRNQDEICELTSQTFTSSGVCEEKTNITTGAKVASCPSGMIDGGSIISTSSYQTYGREGGIHTYYSSPYATGAAGLRTNEIVDFSNGTKITTTTPFKSIWPPQYFTEYLQASPLIKAPYVSMAAVCPIGSTFKATSGGFSTSPNNNSTILLLSCVGD